MASMRRHLRRQEQKMVQSHDSFQTSSYHDVHALLGEFHDERMQVAYDALVRGDSGAASIKSTAKNKSRRTQHERSRHPNQTGLAAQWERQVRNLESNNGTGDDGPTTRRKFPVDILFHRFSDRPLASVDLSHWIPLVNESLVREMTKVPEPLPACL